MDGKLVNDLVMVAMSILMLGALVYAVCWALVAPFKHLRKKEAWDTNNTQNVPPMFQKLLDKAMSERDAEQQRLKERVATLERIVVDSHQRVELSGAIERLNER